MKPAPIARDKVIRLIRQSTRVIHAEQRVRHATSKYRDKDTAATHKALYAALTQLSKAHLDWSAACEDALSGGV